jgi:hypothetical protein
MDKTPSRKTHQNTDRIARIVCKVHICRSFLRSVFTNIIIHVRDLSPALTNSDRGLTYRNRRFSGSFALHLTLAVGAVGILTSFTDALSLPSVYPSAGTTSMHLASDYIHSYRCRLSG